MYHYERAQVGGWILGGSRLDDLDRNQGIGVAEQMRDEISDIYEQLFEMDLPAKAWALIAKLNNLNMLHPDHLAADAKRAKDRERKRAIKESNSADSVENTIILLDNNSEGGVGETNSTLPRKPFDVLAPVLGAELGRAIVEHRQKLRSPLTLKAAEMLAKRLKSFPDPKAAAEKMLERGWKSIDPDWNGYGLGDWSGRKAKPTSPPMNKPEKPIISNEEWRKMRGQQ